MTSLTRTSRLPIGIITEKERKRRFNDLFSAAGGEKTDEPFVQKYKSVLVGAFLEQNKFLGGNYG